MNANQTGSRGDYAEMGVDLDFRHRVQPGDDSCASNSYAAAPELYWS